ncbi:uncharacterized protein LOC143486580 [Brachyhypopomus gauderio]|uniref:uncharacterized protein LOC143486580 n=1 Tax=Brachyhypopomus gauderio TaxID=698409 RepID=UPI0040426E82
MESPVVSDEQPSDRGEDPVRNVGLAEGGDGQNSRTPAGSTKQLCRFYSQGRYCQYGKRCRFLHQRTVPSEVLRGLENRPETRPGPVSKENNVGTSPSDPQLQSETRGGSGKEEHQRPPPARAAPARQLRSQRPCRYFMSGFCAMEDRCRFWHPQRFPPVEDTPPPKPREGSDSGARAPADRPPAVSDQVRLADLTAEMSKTLRATEITQLMKRFPNDKLIVQEREDGQLTYYRVTVEATDPDWPFDQKDIDIMVSFPDSYPQEVFTIDVPEDQNLPSVMGRHVQLASQDWLQAKHATNQLLGRLELLFRPYLRWLDRSMERLFIEGARLLKKDMELERAGIQFVPYEQLQAAVCKTSGPSADLPETSLSGLQLAVGSKSEEEEEEEEDEGSGEEERELGGGEGEGSLSVENIKSSAPRQGTEVKLLGLRLGEGMATVVAKRITVSLQCNRCKVVSDLTLSGQLTCTAQCEKCGAGIKAAFRAGMLHQYCDVLGYLDLNAAVPVDLVLQDCQLTAACLSCNQEDTLQSLPYGQNMETHCQHCHSKLSIFVEATRFQYIQPRTRTQTGQQGSQYPRRFRDPAVQQGKPLPEKGACKHFKQSHRWLRFPCCGRAYPCDACHDEDQDHLMELASRMICGYCAKEQPYSNGKPCVGCGGLMTRGAHTSHWEGGQGCRNKSQMSRNDRQKYNSASKTVSKKAAGEKKQK